MPIFRPTPLQEALDKVYGNTESDGVEKRRQVDITVPLPEAPPSENRFSIEKPVESEDGTLGLLRRIIGRINRER